MKRICILTPGNVSSNPRVVKEADALVEAGYDVRVVAGDVVPWVRERDATVFSRARWRYSLVGSGSRLHYTLRRARRLLASKTLAVGFKAVRIAVAAHSTMTSQLAIAAASESADLYIAHYTAAVPAAAAAARRYKTAFAFDAEDYHLGEFSEDDPARRAIQVIEETYLPQCAYTTAASPRIAEAYSSTYGITRPTVVLNVFPLSHAPIGATSAGTTVPGPSVYWFSQTIGPDRGLETAVAALGLARSRPHLFLRGAKAVGFSEQLTELALKNGVEGRVHILEPEAPADMERLAGAYDIGLVSETGRVENRRIALTNKLFSFVLAGIPIVASAIPAHCDLANALGPALALYDPDSPEQLASAVDGLLLGQDRLAHARSEAWHLGQNRYNWERERVTLVAAVERALALSSSVEGRSRMDAALRHDEDVHSCQTR
jgi:glycosyltransferase involved in cell wall biosynthesis